MYGWKRKGKTIIKEKGGNGERERGNGGKKEVHSNKKVSWLFSLDRYKYSNKKCFYNVPENSRPVSEWFSIKKYLIIIFIIWFDFLLEYMSISLFSLKK